MELLIISAAIFANILGTAAVTFGTKEITKKYVKNEKVATVLNTAVPISASLGVAYATSNMIMNQISETVTEEATDEQENIPAETE